MAIATNDNPYRRSAPQFTTAKNLTYDQNGMPIYNPSDPGGEIHRGFEQNAAQIAAGGDQITNAAFGGLDYYGNRGTTQDQLADEALQKLNQTPGYTPQEAAQINQDFGQYRTSDQDLLNEELNPQEQQWMQDNYANAQRRAEQGNADQGAFLNQYDSRLGTGVNKFETGTNAGLDTLNTGLQGALGSYRGGLDSAQSKFGKLDAAVNDPSLGFDPNSTMKQLSDSDVQNIRNAAGRRVGNMYRSEQDDATRRGLAAGGSPMAIAAERERLAARSAADMGDADANANIQALQSQYQRAADIEGMREGAAQTQAGLRANAATTEQAQAQNAENALGQSGLNAASEMGQSAIQAGKDIGQANINAANDYGQFSTNTAGQMADRGTNAAYQTAQNNNNIILNNQQARTNVNNTRYQQGMETGQATSQGAQTTGNARIQGQGAYRQGVENQQGLSQQGANNNLSQANQAYGTKTSGIVSNTGNRANYENTGPGALGKMGNSLLGAVTSVGSSYAGAHAEGGMISEDGVGTVGEAGPEMVYGRYGNKLVTKPTTALLEEGDTVVPLNNNPRNKTMPRYRAA